MITAKDFEYYTGTKPQDDDLERCNCSRAGQSGHRQCGWNSKINFPVFMVGAEPDHDRNEENQP